MTRKKWNRLRRRRPELFTFLDYHAWERLSESELRGLRTYSVKQAIAILTAYTLEKDR